MKKNDTVKQIERIGENRGTKILFWILAAIVLVLALGFVSSRVYAYSGTSNITAVSVDDDRVNPSDSVTWTVGPILNGTVNPIQNGWGMDFDGTGDFVNVSGPFPNIAYSFSTWLKVDAAGNQYILDATEGAGTGTITWNTNTITVSSGTVYVNGTTTTTLTQGTWGFIVVTGITLNPTTSIILGADNAEANELTGTLDESLLYNRSIGSGEIAYAFSNKVPLNQTGLNVWIDYDQQVQDQSGNGNNGAVNGDPEYVRGIRGKAALTLDGTGDYVEVTHDASLSLTGEMTLSCWIKPTALTGNTVLIDKGRSISANGGYIVYCQDNKIIFYLLDGASPSPSFITTAVVSTGVWTHIVALWDGTYVAGSIKIYFNSVNQAGVETNYGTDPLANVLPVYIGIYNPGSGLFNGSIDEARIYNRALSPTEIAEHYQGIYSNETGLVLYLDFDGQVQDHSGEGNNGVVNGDPEYSSGWANCPVSTSYNGTLGTTVELVNSTTGLCVIPDTAPATAGNYTVTASTPVATLNATYLGFIVDHYLIDLHTSYSETEAGFRALITATGESVIDAHEVTYGDALNVDGVGAMTWSNYTDCFQDTVTSATVATITYDTVTSFLEDTYGITSAEINTTVTVTWTTATLDRLQTKFITGDWIGAIFDEEAYVVGTLTLYTFILGTFSIAIWNVTGPYGTFTAWLLGWIIFAATIHGPAQSMALLLFALGCGIMLAKLYLDRRTT